MTTLAFQQVSPSLLTPSPLNPRTKFKEKDLEDLVGSIRQHGVIEPLIVRPSAKGNGYEIVCGERRWRASSAAGLKEVPIIVRDVDDKAVVELQLEENLKRKDMHPLDEAKGFEELLGLDKQATAASLATQFGVSERYIQNRLHYRDLVKDVRDAFYEDRITSGHVDLIVRLDKAEQKRALEACFAEVFDYEEDTLVNPDGPGHHAPVVRLVSVRELDRWIRGSIRIPTEAKSPKLDLFPEVQQAVQEQAAVPKAERRPLLELTDADHLYGKMDNPPILQRDWKAVGAKKCEHTERGVIVIGARQGQVLDVCLSSTACKIHWPPAPKVKAQLDRGETFTSTGAPRKLSKYELAERAKRKTAARWGKIRKRAYELLRARVKKGVTLKEALPALAQGIYRFNVKQTATLEDLVLRAADGQRQYIERGTFERAYAKPLGLSIGQIEREVFPPKAKPAKKAKKAAKKRGLSKTPPKGAALPLGQKRKGAGRRKAGKKR